MDATDLRSAAAITAWIVLGSALAAALFIFHFFVYLLVAAVVLFGLGIPWMFSGSSGDRRFAIIAFASTVAGGTLGAAWFLVSGWIAANAGGGV